MTIDISSKSAKFPTDPRGQKRLKQLIELGEFDELPLAGLPNTPRYLVTYMNSQTAGRVRSATVVSVTNQSDRMNRVFVSFFKGFTDDSMPVGVAAFAVPPQYTVDFSSRNLPGELTTCNAISKPELVFDEGRAIVSSMWPEIGVSSRVYYTSGERDESLLSITDSNIVVYGRHNQGD
jgi:hypothetical protein